MKQQHDIKCKEKSVVSKGQFVGLDWNHIT